MSTDSRDERLEAYKIWAPDGAQWTAWAKPVLFMSVPQGVAESIEIPAINWSVPTGGTAVVVDLPGSDAVFEGLGLAKMGFRPVPIYNGVNAPSGTIPIVDVSEIVGTLYGGASVLRTLNIPDNAPPVFLLDSQRMKDGKVPGRYDNRWLVFPQDMPSASYVMNKGISSVVVRSGSISHDLAHILRRYQEKGIQILLCDGNVTKEVQVSAPSRFRRLFYRFIAICGLTRNAAGGFGGRIPEETHSHG
jgi:hypothetical protein